MTLEEKLLILSTPITVAMREHKPADVPVGHMPVLLQPALGMSTLERPAYAHEHDR
jgi:hypothetical protein